MTAQRAAAAPPRVSVVVPVLDEARGARALAARLATLDAEVLIVDGGSADGSAVLLAGLLPGARVVTAPRGRARQMNHGARLARGDTLLFLHADSELPVGALERVIRAVDGAGFGCFTLRIASRDPRLRAAAAIISLRSRLLPSATGDQALFVRRDLFAAVGGYPEVELCEDLALVARLRRRAAYAVIDRPVVTSARRWQRCGVARTVALMWCIRASFHAGVPPRALARLFRPFYRPVR